MLYVAKENMNFRAKIQLIFKISEKYEFSRQNSTEFFALIENLNFGAKIQQNFFLS